MGEQPKETVESQLSPEQMKTESAKALSAHLGKIKEEVQDIKSDTSKTLADKSLETSLKKALGITASEQVRIQAYSSSRGRIVITVSSARNPFRIYLSTGFFPDEEALESAKITLSPRSSEVSSNEEIKKAILASLKIPIELYEKDLLFFRSKDKDEITEWKVVQKGKEETLLGIVEINEKTATITKSARESVAIEKTAPKSLKECMAAFAKDGRIKDMQMRKTVEAVIRSELTLPEQYAKSDLFLSGKMNGDIFEITVEDKKSEAIIATIGYDTKSNRFVNPKVEK